MELIVRLNGRWLAALLSVALFGCRDQAAGGEPEGTPPPSQEGQLQNEGAPAADTTAPTWPEDAGLLISSTQIVYDQPATTEDELLQRQREEQLELRWTLAQDDVGVTHYRVARDGEVLETWAVADLHAGRSSLSHSLTTTQSSGVYSVEAGDAAGNWSTGGPSMTWQHVDTDVDARVLDVLGGQGNYSTFGTPDDTVGGIGLGSGDYGGLGLSGHGLGGQGLGLGGLGTGQPEGQIGTGGAGLGSGQ